MSKYDYDQVIKDHLQEGILIARPYSEDSLIYEATIKIYTFPKLDLEAAFLPFFTTDRLDHFKIQVGGKKKWLKYYPTLEQDYNRLLQHFELIYGKPSRQARWEKGHRSAYWEKLKGFNLTLSYMPSRQDWEEGSKLFGFNGLIEASFTPKEKLQIILDKYNEDRKRQLREIYVP